VYPDSCVRVSRRFEPPRRAGQYITVAENPSQDPHFAPRHYTISCRPADAVDRLRITVKRLAGPSAGIEGGIMSSFVNGLKAGDVVSLRVATVLRYWFRSRQPRPLKGSPFSRLCRSGSHTPLHACPSPLETDA